MNSTKKYFMEKHNLNIYKNTTSHLQFLQQGEIDVLGLEVQDRVMLPISMVWMSPFMKLDLTMEEDWYG